MDATSASAPRDDLRRSVIESMFVLLYDRDEVTKSHAATMPITNVDGSKTQGISAARTVLINALAGQPDAFAEWLSAADQVKVSLSLSLAMDDDLRRELSERPGTANLLSQLRSVDRDYARDLSLSESGTHRAIRVDQGTQVIDLREQEAAKAPR